MPGTGRSDPRRCGGFTMIELLTVVAIISVLISLLLPAVQAAREAARRTQCGNNMMQLALAIANYEASHRVYPPGVVNETGPILNYPAGYHMNWVVQILPQIGQRNLYDKIDFDRGIYDAGNNTVLGVTIVTMLCPSLSSSGSSYAACHNDESAPIDVNNRGVFFLNSRVRPDDVTDGLANTIFLGEVSSPGSALGWFSGTSATLRNTGFTPNSPLNMAVENGLKESQEHTVPDPFMTVDAAEMAVTAARHLEEARAKKVFYEVGGFSSAHPRGANFAFGDGSVRLLPNNISSRLYRLLGRRDDGEPISDGEF